jgi:branched-chain amino acid transport system substrate-binding protein
MSPIRQRALAVLVISSMLTACNSTASPAASPGGAASASPGASAAGSASGPTIKIGALYPLSGDNAAYGNDGLAAVQIAADLFNKQGGVNGRQVEIVPADVTTPDQAQSEAQRLITTQNVHVLTGTTLSLLGLPASAIADRLGALYWDGVDASPEISGRGLKHVFQNAPHGDEQGKVAANFAAEALAPALGKQPSDLKVGITYTNDAFGSSVGQGISATAKTLGLNVVLEQSYDPKITDLSPLILKLKSLNVDVMLMSTFQPDAILFIKQAKQQGFNPIIEGGLGFDNPDSVKALGDCINGVFLSSNPQFSAIDPSKLTADGKTLAEAYSAAWKAKTGRDTSVDSDQNFNSMWTFLKYVLAPVGDDSKVDDLAAKARTLDLPLGTLANGFGVKYDDHQYNTRTVQSVNEYQSQKETLVYPKEPFSAAPITMVPRPDWSQVCK